MKIAERKPGEGWILLRFHATELPHNAVHRWHWVTGGRRTLCGRKVAPMTSEPHAYRTGSSTTCPTCLSRRCCSV